MSEHHTAHCSPVAAASGRVPGAGGDRGAGEALALRHVSFTYPDATTPALRDVSLQVRQGEMVVILGASGAGKSTLVKCLNRVIPAFQSGEFGGEVRIFGRRLVGEKVGALAGVIGMVFQDFEAQLFSTTVRDEIIFGMEQLGVNPVEMPQRLETALAQVGLTGFEMRDPTTLSGGQKQRLAIAALLALRPRILVLDEPGTDLDPQGRREIFTLLGRMRAEGYTLVVVEHELAVATTADRLVILSAGQIVAEGPPEHLLPQVETLTRYGVRPRDIDRMFHLIGVSGHARSVEEAAKRLQNFRASSPSPLRQRGEHGSTRLTTGSARGDFAERSGGNPPQPPFTKGEDRDLSSDLRIPAVPLLQLQSVSYAYPGGPAVVRDVSLSIGEGEFIALLGQNGSGKTTLAKQLSGLLSPTMGRVFLRGRELSQFPLHELAQEVSYVFQNPDHQLFAETVEEEVAFGPRNIGLSLGEVNARVDEALAAVGLSDVRGHDPFLLGKGERQRLAVAALLALHPRVLILDEPTTGLDYQEQRRIMELLRRLHREGRTVIIITHVPWVAAEYAGRALLMADGALLWDGPLRALCARPEVYARAAFCPPDVTLVGAYFGVTPLSVEEFVGWME